MKKLIPCLLLLASLNAHAQQTPNLVAHWNFNNGSTSDVVNGWTSTVGGSPSATIGFNGQANTALKFNQGDFLRIASHPKMNLTSWTLMALVRPDGFYSGSCQVNSIIWRGRDQEQNHYDLRFFDNPYDKSCNVFTPTKEVFTAIASDRSNFPADDWYKSHQNPNPFIVPGTWYCVIAMYDAQLGTTTTYVDGKQVTAALPWANTYDYSSNPVLDLCIGYSGDATGNYPYFFNGAIDELKMYDGVFTFSSEVSLPCLIQQPEDPISVAEASAQHHLSVFPNPATERVTITVPQPMISGKIVITNTMGAVVKEVVATSQTTIDIHDLAAGLYIVRMHHNGHTSTTKFTVSK